MAMNNLDSGVFSHRIRTLTAEELQLVVGGSASAGGAKDNTSHIDNENKTWATG